MRKGRLVVNHRLQRSSQSPGGRMHQAFLGERRMQRRRRQALLTIPCPCSDSGQHPLRATTETVHPAARPTVGKEFGYFSTAGIAGLALIQLVAFADEVARIFERCSSIRIHLILDKIKCGAIRYLRQITIFECLTIFLQGLMRRRL